MAPVALLVAVVLAAASFYAWGMRQVPARVPALSTLPQSHHLEAEPPSLEIRTLGPPPLEVELPPVELQLRYTLAERLEKIGPAATGRLIEKFSAAGVRWPPRQIVLVALKDENLVELHARFRGRWHLVHRYPIQKASGGPGPKLREGDRQVPEGVYSVTFLNPNSRYHVSLRLDYPNAFDQAMGARDGRSELGGDIMIHGKAASVGCLAMGDEAAEELFVLAAAVSLPKIKVIIAPTDFRKVAPLPPADKALPWLSQLYADIAREMAPFRSNL